MKVVQTMFFPLHSPELVKLSRLVFLVLIATSSLCAQVHHGTVEVTGTENSNTELTPSFLSSSSIVFPEPPNPNFGDYALTLPGDVGVEVGVLITSIASNGVDGAVVGRPSSAAADGAFTADLFSISVHAASAGDNIETNSDVAFAWFNHTDWIGGTMRNLTNNGAASSLLASAGIDLGEEFVDSAGSIGIYELDLLSAPHNASSQDGVLLVNGAKNEDNYALSHALPDGTFRIFCRDNFNATFLENDPVNFVYLGEDDLGRDGLVAMGRIQSNSIAQAEAGDFSVTNGTFGTWKLTIPGHSPETGTLLISPEGGGSLNDDNIVSHQWNGVDGWIIESRDISSGFREQGSFGAGTIEEPIFSFAFFERMTTATIIVTTDDDEDDGPTALEDLDDISLREAIKYGGTSKRIIFAEETFPGLNGLNLIFLNRELGEMVISGNVEIDGSSISGEVRIDADGVSGSDPSRPRIFRVENGATVELNDLRLVDGKAPSGATGADASGQGSESGGGNGGHGESGGAIYCEGDLTLRDCIFESNQAGDGGAGGTGAVLGAGGMGGSGGDGGAIYSSGSLVAINCSFFENSPGAGGLRGNGQPNGEVGMPGSGGAIFQSGGTVLLEDCSFSSNTTSLGNGGAMAFSDSTTGIISACTFEGNRGGFGGAVFTSRASPSFVNCIFRGNDAIEGGVVFLSASSATTFTNCIFQGNTAQIGGAAYIDVSAPTFTNCTFQGNRGSTSTGAIHSEGIMGASTAIINCIVWNNASGDETSSQAASLQNSAQNTTAIEYSLIQNWTEDQVFGSNNLDGTDPANNPFFLDPVDPFCGATTAGDLRLATVTPVINAGNNLANDTLLDLAGRTRIEDDVIDLGAYEGAEIDAAILWLTDLDGDGFTYGVEVAIGTDPFAIEPPDGFKQLGSPSFQLGGGVLFSFGRDPNAPEGTTLKLMRSTDLTAGSWVEIFRVTPSDDGTDIEGGNGLGVISNVGIRFLDNDPPSTRAYYRLEAEFAPGPN